MIDSKAGIERGVAIELMYSLYPPTIRSGLLNQNEFIERFDIQIEQWIKLAGSGISLLKPQLHEVAIKLFENAELKPTLDDKNSTRWTASLDDKNRGVIVLKAASQVLRLPSFWMLMPEPSDRICELEKAANINGLSISKLTAWKETLSERRAQGDEVDLLFQDFVDTIVNVEKKLRRSSVKKKE